MWVGPLLSPMLLGIFVETQHNVPWQPCLCLHEADTPGKPRAVYRHRGERAWEQLLEETEVGLGKYKAT